MKQEIQLENKTILITGAAGFIGANLVMKLLQDYKHLHLIGIDNMNDYYDVSLKEYRLKNIEDLAAKTQHQFEFVRGDICDSALVAELFETRKPAVVVNLAAQAGVRYSITNPDVYIQSNIIGFYNILEACRKHPVEHLVYASSSSVYGSNKKVPYATEDKVDNPVSLYAATKKSNELLAHAYSKLYNIPSTGLRFFTVYGPAGRPDMAYFSFTDKLIKGETIKIFNYGNCKRDFTYIDDIVEGVKRVMQKAPAKECGEDGLPIPPYAIYNIGNHSPENLLEFVEILQQELLRAGVLPEDYDFEAHKQLVPMQPGDVPITYADTTGLEQDFGFKPKTSLRDGLRNFANWYAHFYQAKNQGGPKMKVAVAGTGYVGLSIATLIAQNHEVVAVDIIPEKVDKINQRISPIQDEYIETYFAQKQLNLVATLDAEQAYRDADFVVVAAPTNYDSQKNFFDTSAVESVIETVLQVNKKCYIIIKSTIPVGYTESVRKNITPTEFCSVPNF